MIKVLYKVNQKCYTIYRLRNENMEDHKMNATQKLMPKKWILEKLTISEQDAIRSGANSDDFAICQETEKAVKFEVSTDFGKIWFWCPKSATVTIEEFDAMENAKYDNINFGFEYNEFLVKWAKENKVKGVRAGLRTETLLKKIIEAGLIAPTKEEAKQEIKETDEFEENTISFTTGSIVKNLKGEFGTVIESNLKVTKIEIQGTKAIVNFTTISLKLVYEEKTVKEEDGNATVNDTAALNLNETKEEVQSMQNEKNVENVTEETIYEVEEIEYEYENMNAIKQSSIIGTFKRRTDAVIFLKNNYYFEKGMIKAYNLNEVITAFDNEIEEEVLQTRETLYSINSIEELEKQAKEEIDELISEATLSEPELSEAHEVGNKMYWEIIYNYKNQNFELYFHSPISLDAIKVANQYRLQTFIEELEELEICE